MITLMIFEEIPEKITIFMLNGDHRKFDGIYINTSDTDASLQDELSALIYDEDGKVKEKHRVMTTPLLLDDIPTANTFLIKCGFIL